MVVPAIHRLLVIDDDHHAAEGLRMLLELDGYRVVALRSPSEALRMLQSETFDAVITDLEMPKYHGMEVLKAAQAIRPDLPVFFITGYHGTPRAAEALGAGARRVFAKPIDYDELANELAVSLKER